MRFLTGLLTGLLLCAFLTFDHTFKLEQNKIKKHQIINSIKEEIPEQVYIIKPSDANRLEDCSDESYIYHGGKLKTHPFMEFFEMKNDPLNAFFMSANSPVYHYIHGLNRLDDETAILIGFRGNTAGPHRSRVTSSLYKVYERYKDTLIYMPSTFHNKGGEPLDKAILQSVCHRRFYDGQYLGSGWKGMSDGNSWRVINKLFKNKNRLFVFAYSNGQIVREDLITTANKEGFLRPTYAAASNSIEFLNDYDYKTYFKYDSELSRIYGLVDIETNYSSGQPLWDLAKFIKNHIDGDSKKIYYAACGIESPVAMNHIRLIQSLGLLGFELSNGVVRYMNDQRNIIIDILTLNKSNPYTFGYVNLEQQTIFLKDNRVSYRLSLGHYMIVPYVTDQFAKLANERGLITD